ncbi:MAG: Fic family protein [Oscillospiraceae bacterium]|nr:Fic family protein [Oscillospiraceae bacterium]
MYVGGLISPSKEIQMRIAEKGLETLPKIDDDKARAALAYYLINLLHMYSDGNGRTSRLIYEILNNPEFDIPSKSEQYTHKEGEDSGVRNFYNIHGIMLERNALGYASKVLFDRFNQNRKNRFSFS